MPIRSILVPLTGLDSDQGTLDLALVVARDPGAHIAALLVNPDPAQAMAYAGMGTEGLALQQLTERLEREAAETSARARQRFEAWRAAHGLPEATRPAKA